MKLGKRKYKHDEKTIMLGTVLDELAPVPSVYDFDKNRAPFPTDVWGNDRYGDCVMAGRTNHLLRLERVETRRTPRITAKEVIDKYFELSGGQDSGLVVLDALVDWRNNGWEIPTAAGIRHYFIDAFGELEVANRKQIRQSIYYLHGAQFGIELPISAQEQTRQGYWDVATGPDSEPGSWGGHLVAGFKYDFENVYVKSWGKEIKVSNAFIEKYCDEVWAVVDKLDPWKKNDILDVAKLREILKDIGAHVRG